MELISVEQQEDLVHRVSLPNPCSYAHGFREKVGRRAKAQGAQSVCIIGCNQATGTGTHPYTSTKPGACWIGLNKSGKHRPDLSKQYMTPVSVYDQKE